jgi:hypothetical protein
MRNYEDNEDNKRGKVKYLLVLSHAIRITLRNVLTNDTKTCEMLV